MNLFKKIQNYFVSRKLKRFGAAEANRYIEKKREAKKELKESIARGMNIE